MNGKKLTHDSTEKKLRGLHAARCASITFRMFYTFGCKNFSSCRLKIPGKNCRQIYLKSKVSVWRNLSTVTD